MALHAQVRYVNDEWRHRPDVPTIGDRETRRANTSKHTVEVHDARPALAAGDIDLDANGFALLRHTSQVADFHDDAEVKAVYYPEIETLVKRRTGAVAVFFTQHLIRTEDTRDFNKAYARFLHCDYSLKDARGMARRTLARHGQADAYDGHEFAWFNTWQPFDHPARRNPLALVDAATLADDDVLDYRYTGFPMKAAAAAAAVVRGVLGCRGGRGWAVDDLARSSIPARNPAHRFYYVPNMAVDELLLFRQLDTRRQGGVCPHTSFDDPTTSPDAPPRRSIEVRLMAVFAPTAR